MKTLTNSDDLRGDRRTRPPVHQKKLYGIACSAGKVTGPARVVRSAEDWKRVGVGDIVVCEAIPADGTRLFAIIKGLVSDQGGMLSNAAIVARERKLPAVVGTQIGTRVIRDGQRITIDGRTGCVLVDG